MTFKGRIMEIWHRLLGQAGHNMNGDAHSVRLDPVDQKIKQLEQRTQHNERVLRLYETERGTISGPPRKRKDGELL